MTSSQPVLSDPLAPAVTAAAPVSPAQPAAQNESPPPQKKGSGALLLILGGGLLLLLLLGGGAAALFFLPQGPPTAVVAAPPVPPDPGQPSPLPEFKLEEFVPEKKDTNLAEHDQLVKTAASRFPPRFLVGSGEAVAPQEFVVRGGGLSDVAGSDIPNHERWSFQFPPGTTIEAYTRQLDFFKIELGVIGGSQNVTYLTNLSNPKPQTRQAPGNADTRLYLIWNSGPMHEADEILVGRAGLNAEGKVLAHFCSPQLEAELLRLESAQAKTNNLARVRRTVFGIQAAGADAFRLVVLEQKGD